MKQFALSMVAALMLALPVRAETPIRAEVYGTAKAGIPGVEGPQINFLDGKIILSLKLLNLEIEAGGGFVIPKTKDSRFELLPNIMDGGTLVQVTLDPSEIKGVKVAADPHTLPDGRAIPGIPGGQLPSLRVDTEWFKSSYYFAKTLFGIYVPLKVNTSGIGGTLTFKINNKVGGSVNVVASDANGKNAAFLVFFQKKALDAANELLEESARNPGVLY